jgi:hypothetical protein
VRDDESHDVEGIVHETFERRIGETEDDGEDGAGEVAEERGPDRWERPVFAASNYDVEIVSELVTLSICQYGLTGMGVDILHKLTE